MKKLLLPFLLFLMFIPFTVNGETCDTDKITIENITIVDKAENVEEISEATTNGKNINLNISMSEVGDNIEYKFVIKNDSNEDYELDKTSLNLNSEHINYLFETDDNSNIVKANSSKNVMLRVEYKTEVPEDKFENGTYSDNKSMTVQLSNENTIDVPDTFKNPNTGVQSYILIFMVILLVSGTIYVLLKKKKYVKFMIILICCSIIIPISVYALCKCGIKVDSKIEIKKKLPQFCYAGTWACGVTKESSGLLYYDFIEGETFQDYYDRTGIKMQIDTFWKWNDAIVDSDYFFHVNSGSGAWDLIKDKVILGKESGCYSECPD